MTCRHKDPINNSECGSYETPEQQIENAKRHIAKLQSEHKLSTTPDNTDFEIEDVIALNGNIVLKVKYPSCAACSYEGCKVLVYLGTDLTDVLKWREIDPHFREDLVVPTKRAPGPDARFPASPDGWQDAKDYAVRRKSRPG